MAIETAATPAMAPASDDLASDPFAVLDMEDAGEPSPADELASDPQDGDADEAPEPGDDAETDDEADEAETPDETPALDMATPVKVKVNGAEIEVPLEEALKGYSRLEDYKAKTAELAEQGRALHGELAERLQTALQTFVMTDPVLSAVNDIDWAQLAEEDPATFVGLKAKVEQRQQVIAAAQQQIAAARDYEAQATAQREYELLVKADPSLADAATYDKRIDEITGYLRSQHNFSKAELEAINNHKYVIIAGKAAAFDKLMAAKKELPAKVAPPPRQQVKPMRPSAGSAQSSSRSSRPPPANATQSQWQAWFEKNA